MGNRKNLVPCARCGNQPVEREIPGTREHDIMCECFEPGVYRMVATGGRTALGAKRAARKMWNAANQKGGE